MKKLFKKVKEWMMAALKNTLCVYGDNNDDVDTFRLKGERLEVKGDRFGETVSSYPLPLRVLPLTQGESASSTKSEESLLIRIEEFIDENFHVRYNILSQQHEVAPRDTEQWMPVNGTLCNRILMELNRSGIILAKPYLVKTVIEGGALEIGRAHV